MTALPPPLPSRESHATNRTRMAREMSEVAWAEFGYLDAASRAHARFLVAHAGLDWFLILARQTGRKTCSIDTADTCRELLLERLAPAPSIHKRTP